MHRLPVLFGATILSILAGCSPPGPDATSQAKDLAGFTMRTGYELAAWQDTLLARYRRGDSLPLADRAALRGNAWVATAKHLAPSNLILRQWALTDLFSKTPENAARILEMADLLAPDSGGHGGRMWAEGYSYWLYTREVLAPWAETFRREEAGKQVRALINAVDSCFTMTAYSRNGILYPAPFGDLRDKPLADSGVFLHAARPVAAHSCAFVTVTPVSEGYDYRIAAQPVGLNTHIPADTQVVAVRQGVPAGFGFYQGYHKKYPDAAAERGDMMRPARLASIARLRLRDRFRD
jgi:hypothetical protein